MSTSPAGSSATSASKSGLWMALIAAILGWMFDGFEMGLFPLVAKPALTQMVTDSGTPAAAVDGRVGNLLGVMTAGFLVGASSGGVIFGWLGDRIGRVRAMTLSVFTYAIFSGLCGFATEPWHLFAFRFLASLGMGGEWSLGVSLVMELWPGRSRGWLAGLIGAASNVGFVMIAVIGLGLTSLTEHVSAALHPTGLSERLVSKLTEHSCWRLLMICGALPAVLTFFIRLFVPESEKWAEENASGRTRQWSSTDLLAVVGGTLAALAMICVWADPDALPFTLPAFVVDNLKVQIPVTVLGLVAAYFGYTYPARKYLQRSTFTTADHVGVWTGKRVLGRMLIGSLLSGVALMGTWASLQNAPSWADQLARKQAKEQNMSVQATAEHAGSARAATQIASGFGAIAGTIGAALLGTAIGRRWSYFLLCVAALGSSLAFFKLNSVYGTQFVSMAFLAGGLTASFYGWLPLYLPELFPTRVRAFGQGFAFNFGRILAAVGALQFAYLMRNVFEGSYPKACSVLSLIYLVGMVVIWFAPETHKQPLPE